MSRIAMIPFSWFACDGLRFVDPATLDEEMLAAYEKIVEENNERSVILSMMRAALNGTASGVDLPAFTPLDANGESDERHTLPITRKRFIPK